MKTFLQSLRLFALLTLLTGALYPLAIWATGHAFFRNAAEGSLLTHNNRIIGSALLAQKNPDPRYFQPRPSAGDYATVPSGASNQPWTSAKLAASVITASTDYRTFNQLAPTAPLPSDAITSSGSGLDPHISLANARLQLSRVARARNLTTQQLTTLDTLLARHTEGGHLTPARVNVLRLNLALDKTL
ncbi:K(+)-transporting ATPase subunit C [Nibricoccus aquaticus]|uniref:Potassium-transporting ATPase KdpC subunit n=1 Tax=Nibricoccus aquaticus TaxID=2576891 RepID=A0A290QJ35_9BACT|nr:K(+)-transporting ATPase subunit C [Nibricoccus aquaticus]ATC65338.1 K(+)-transporting ATPase subunit C [Nibricoccus aquaticus]